MWGYPRYKPDLCNNCVRERDAEIKRERAKRLRRREWNDRAEREDRQREKGSQIK